jgi:trans-2,3-dihydro-3-hydroxyanthranilate isomerase
MFAGHPTVGTALALRDLGLVSESLVLELGVGPIPVEITGNRARFVTRVPLAVEDAPSPAMIATCLGLPEAAIRTNNHAPVLAGLGTNFVLVELATLNDLTSAHGVLDAFHAAKPEGAVRFGIFLYVRDGAKIEARMFSPLSGIPEDPATGSASAALAAYLGQLDGRSQSFAISQGVAMGRPSQIAAEVTVDNGKPVAVAIEGSAVKVMEGRLML